VLTSLMIALLPLIGCGSEPAPTVDPITSAEASAAAARIFCEASTQAGGTCAADGAVATIGEHTVELTVTVKDFVALNSRSLGVGSSAQQIPGEVQLVADVGVSVDGKPVATLDFTHAANDVDLTVARTAVLEELIQRWMVGYGLAALDAVGGDGAPALAGVGMKVAPVALEGATAWSAYPMLSGQGLDPKTGGRMAPQVTSMAKGLGPYVEGLAPGLHSVHIKAELGGPGGPGACGILPPVAAAPGASISMVRLVGEVKVDGAAGADICELSETVAWPLPKSQVQLTWEQFFVVRVDAS